MSEQFETDARPPYENPFLKEIGRLNASVPPEQDWDVVHDPKTGKVFLRNEDDGSFHETPIKELNGRIKELHSTRTRLDEANRAIVEHANTAQRHLRERDEEQARIRSARELIKMFHEQYGDNATVCAALTLVDLKLGGES